MDRYLSIKDKIKTYAKADNEIKEAVAIGSSTGDTPKADAFWDSDLWYNLKGHNETEAQFYQCSKELSVLLEEKIEKRCNDWVLQFLDYTKNDNVVTEDWYVPGEKESALELLLLGVTYRWYSFSQKGVYPESVYYYDLMSMLVQLDASHEFGEELFRWRVWMRFFVSLGGQEWQQLWKEVFDVLLWLQKTCQQKLQQFLSPEKHCFAKYSLPHKAKGDDYLVYRDALFYYINMLGAQILNRSYRSAFEKAEKYYIFLPGCMTAKEGCQAKNLGDGFGCAGCRSECMVNVITQKYQKLGGNVRILYHESEMNQHYVLREEKVGVIGVSCVLNLLSGGFMARRLGYIPQCVILNFPGCKQHWEKQECLVTRLNLQELENVFMNKERESMIQ